jgi:hypothetical protein
MIDREPHLPRFMAGGEGNPLGARALYLGKSVYRIHGTNQPSTIGTFVSSGCIRLTNEDIIDFVWVACKSERAWWYWTARRQLVPLLTTTASIQTNGASGVTPTFRKRSIRWAI